MSGILASDWWEQVQAEQARRSVALLHAASGADPQVVDYEAARCQSLDHVRLYAGLLAEACQRAGWGLATSEAERATFGRLDEGE